MAQDGVTDGDEPVSDATLLGTPSEGIGHLRRFSTFIEHGKTILDGGCGDGVPVDAYLVTHGFAANGIDASAGLIARARTNVPDGFYDVKDLGERREGAYCVDGIVSLLPIPKPHVIGRR